MKTITSMMIVALLSSSLAGCIIESRSRTRTHHSHVHKRDKRACPPAYHWDGRGCVHNGRGKAKGHRK